MDYFLTHNLNRNHNQTTIELTAKESDTEFENQMAYGLQALLRSTKNGTLREDNYGKTKSVSTLQFYHS